MRFDLLVLINLAAVISVGRTSLDLLSYSHEILPKECLPCVKKNKSCEVSENKPIEYAVHAIPYLCLLLINTMLEASKVPDRLERIVNMNETESNKPVCPIKYTLKVNLNVTITNGVQYIGDIFKCKSLCLFDEDLQRACNFIALGNEIITKENMVKSADGVKDSEKPPQDPNVNADKSVADKNSQVKSNSKMAPHMDTTPKDNLGGKKTKYDVSSATESKFDNGKTFGKTDIKLNEANVDLKPKFENEKITDTLSSYNSKGNKGKFGAVKSDDKLAVESSKNKEDEITESQVLPSNGNTYLSEPESPPGENNVPSSRNYDKKKELGDVLASQEPGDEGEDEDNNDSLDKSGLQDAFPDREPQFAKSVNAKEIYSSDNFFQVEDSHFSAYFLMTISIIIIGYIVYHNKNKIVAYALEGRRSRNGRRRPTSASYRKLDCNLEEAIASNPSNASVTNVVY